MDLQTWKTAVKDRVQQSMQFIEQMTPGTLYGALSAATILPVVTAANQGNFGALVALTGVVGGIGGNLIANQLQAWKDRTDEELAAELAARAARDPEWRHALDLLLDKLDTLRVVQAILSEADKDWFVRTLQAELEKLGSSISLELVGSGAAVIGDDNVTAGARGVAGGEIRNSAIITGDHNFLGSVETLTIQSAVFQAPAPSGQMDPKHLLWTYLNQVVGDTATLDLSGVDLKAASDQEEARLELAAVYTALDTLRSTADESSANMHHCQDRLETLAYGRERQSVLGFVNEHGYAALLGDPGSGKTTFVNFLALCLAGELLGLKNINLARLGDEWTAGALLPVRVVLRNFAAQLDRSDVKSSPGEQLWEHIIRRMGKSLSAFAPLLQKHLVEEGGLLLLDGLDEVPEAHQHRETVKKAVVGFRRQFPRVRILLTSRTYAYQRQEWQMPEFDEAVLAMFNDAQIDAFIDQWYAHISQVRSDLTAEDAQGRATVLKQAIARSDHLRDLAPRPLLLTLMASLHAWRGGSLPEQREALYEESVDLLIDIWERPKTVHDRSGKPLLQTASAAVWFQAPRARIRHALEELAFTVHQSQDESTDSADIAEDKLVAILVKASGDPDLPPIRVVEYIRDRAGLLANRGEGIYSFPHRTFQEYLAARYLTRTGFPKQLIALVNDDPERWREVLLLAGAKVARGTPYAAWSLISRLCSQHCDENISDKATHTQWRMAFLAGQLLLETDIYQTEILDDDERQILQRVVSWLTHLVSGGHLPAVDRATAGVALGVLGDPRPGVGLKDGLPDIDWIEIASGPFLMGDEKFTCNLIRDPYRISRYPITVAQYRVFVEAGGYKQQEYWTKEGWAWRQQGDITGPESYGGVYQTLNHPQVGVSWYEAVAFCAWLSTQLGYCVSLPTEAQWERAARHTDGRAYPWGGDFDYSRCNVNDTDIGNTSAVGIFPNGDAGCGAADMSGNVDEWCCTKWREDYNDYENHVDDDLAGTERRVLRGGAFYFNVNSVRCASRFRFTPGYRNYFVGMRVAAPGSAR